MSAPALLLTEADVAATRVRDVVLPDGWSSSGAYLLPGILLVLAKDGEGLGVTLSAASAKSLAAELMRLANAKELEAAP